MKADRVKIILAGGGSMGPVSPLLAVASHYQADYLFIGTKEGPEAAVVRAANIKFTTISSAKLRRYFDWKNFLDLINFVRAFFQSWRILIKFKPHLILTAGGFIAVPVVWAAWFLKIPAVVHQQDMVLGLANRMMAPVATKITVVFSDQIKFFKTKKVLVTGNPVRNFTKNDDGPPVILITGGGLGARGLNNFLNQFIPDLVKKYEVHHIVGEKNWDQHLELPNYYPYKFALDNMSVLLARAEIIISRAGMSLISEAAALKKALILIPITDNQQERNAAWLAQRNAAYVVKQGSKHIMDRYLSKLLTSDKLRHDLGNNLYNLFPKNAVQKYCDLIEEIVSK